MREEKMSGREILEKAMLRYEEEIGRENPCLESEQAPDAASRRRMRHVMKHSRKPRQTNRGFFRTGWAVAAVLICVILYESLVTVSAAREEIVGFLVQTYDKITIDGPKSIEKVYTMEDLPEGYTLLTRNREEKHVTTLWKRENNLLIFEQDTLYKKISFGDDAQMTSFYHNGLEMLYIRYENRYRLYWKDSEYHFLLKLPDEVLLEDALRMVDSLQIKHGFDYETAHPYNEDYHYYTCIACAYCEEKRFKMHEFVLDKESGTYTCRLCGYPDE